MSYFPMFVELDGEDCLVVGGGMVALRKVMVLRDFGAAVTVMAEHIIPEIREMAGVVFQEKPFVFTDLSGRGLVVAATGDRELNHEISQRCRQQGIPVNVVDQPEDCSFIFPAYLREGEVVAAFSSGGQSPVVTQYLKEQMGTVMNGQFGEIAAFLGSIRHTVKQCVGTKKLRKCVYRELLQIMLAEDSVLSEEKIMEILEKYKDGEIEKIKKAENQ